MQTINQSELKSFIKSSIKEALEEELINIRLLALPDISEKEMKDIASRYKRPEKKSVYSEKIDL